MKITNYIVGLLAGVLATSCNTLDTKPFESYDDEVVWGSKESADAFVINAYNGSVTSFIGQNANMESYTPNGIHSDLSSLDQFPYETMDRYHNSGFGKFGDLRNANLIIKKAQESSVLNPQQVKELVAEGHFLRAVSFFRLALWQGRFVPITEYLNENDTQAFHTPLTASPVESYKLITDDLTKALEMPETSLSGRANRYAAHAFRSRVALQAYAYTGDASYIDMAIASANAIISSGRYTLSSNYGNMFNNEDPFNGEIILGYYRKSINTTVGNFNEMIRIVPNINNREITLANGGVDADGNPLAGGGPFFKDANGRSFEGWAQYFPTQDLVDQYLVVDDADGTAKAWYETSQYLNAVSEQPAASLAKGDFAKAADVGHDVPEDADMGSNDHGSIIVRYGVVNAAQNISDIMYQNRDRRFSQTIVHDQSTWLKEDVTTNIRGNLWAGIRSLTGGQSDSWYTTATGYYWRKGVVEADPRVYVSNRIDYHFVLARLGEVYLNLAEAQLLKGNVGEAVAALNMTRVTHGGLPASTAATLEDAWKDYIRERRVEMAYENDIYWSYLRWGKYGGFANYGLPAGDVVQDLNKSVHKIQITTDRSKFFVAQVTRNQGNRVRVFTPKRYLMPIPQGQLDTRSASGINDAQNPGW
ncbi:MAG: RagB/SusD family nutrient uptake outer membrane protein [Capnocytophaga sp.]|nr:RagB/SusD family nutrient uptake outer membrane protein [Capnocytophaga sp.]